MSLAQMRIEELLDERDAMAANFRQASELLAMLWAEVEIFQEDCPQTVVSPGLEEMVRGFNAQLPAAPPSGDPSA